MDKKTLAICKKCVRKMNITKTNPKLKELDNMLFCEHISVFKVNPVMELKQ